MRLISSLDHSFIIERRRRHRRRRRRRRCGRRCHRQYWISEVLANAVLTEGPTDGRTDGPTNGPTNRPTDGWTDIACYRDARTHLKRNSILNLIFLGSYCIFSVIIKVKKYMLGLFWYTFIPSTNLGVFFHHRLSWPKIYETWLACPTKTETDKTHVGDILMHIVSQG